MTPFEIIVILISSGLLSALLALFYRFGRNQEKQDNHFKCIDDRMQKIASDLNTKIDKIASDLNTKIDKIASDLTNRIDRNEARFNAKIDPIEKDLIQMNTKIAVIESRLSDISTNVTYLMWQNQAILPKEEQKEN